MAYTYNFSVTASELVSDALTDIGVLADGEAASAEAMAHGIRRLNILIKNIMAPNNRVLPGLKMFQRTIGTVGMNIISNIYQLGATAASCTFTDTGDLVTKAAHGLSNGTWIQFPSITTTTGISIDTTYYVVSRTINTFQVAAARGGTALALTTNGTGTYITNSFTAPPVEILTALLRDTSNNDTVLSPMTLEEYQSIGNKQQTGMPSKFYYERQISAGYIYLDVIPNDATDILSIVALRELEDIDSSSDTIYFSKEWYRPLLLQMALELSPSYGRQADPLHVELLKQSTMLASSVSPEQASAYFQPDKD